MCTLPLTFEGVSFATDVTRSQVCPLKGEDVNFLMMLGHQSQKSTDNNKNNWRGDSTQDNNKKKLIKVAFLPEGICTSSFPCTSHAYSERTWRAGGLFCTCSVGDDDADWHIACRERSYRAE